MIRIHRAFLVILLAAFCLVAGAKDGPTVCEELLFSDPTDIDSDLGSITDPTVRIGAVLPGKHGGQRLEVEKTGATWASGYTTVGYDPQGDPRWLVDALGCDEARYFGFEILSDTKAIVPNRAELMGAIEKINVHLKSKKKQPIEITYYDADEKNVKVKDYISNYLSRRGLPLASGGNHFLHDISFHTGAILAPKVALDFMAAKTQYMSEFADHLEMSFAEGTALEQKAAKVIAHRIRHRAVELIDGATALLSFYWISKSRVDRLDYYQAAPALFFAMSTSDETGRPSEVLLDYIKTKPLTDQMKFSETERGWPGKIISAKQIETILKHYTDRVYPRTVRVVSQKPEFNPHTRTFQILEKAFALNGRNFDKIWIDQVTNIRAAVQALSRVSAK